MKKTFLIILFVICFLPKISLAADIFFKTEKNIFAEKENFLVQVFLDTKEARVNAIEGNIIFPAGLLELKEVRDGNSAINFWVEKPHSTGEGKITFSGITTGGFSGSKMFLFGLVFQSKMIGESSIIFQNIQVLENDGLGTKISVKNIPFIFSISREAKGSAPEDLTIKDTEMPEDFKPFIASDANMFNGKYFLVFSTVDKGSGIDHYEVRESFWGFGGKYITTESPYLLMDQTLKDKIYVKAVDKAGNERIVGITAQNILALLEQLLILGIIFIICFFLYRKYGSKLHR